MKKLLLPLLFLAFSVPAFSAAPALVQSKDCSNSGFTDSPGLDCTFNSTPSTGNFVIGIYDGVSFGGNPVLGSCSDNKGNSYQIDLNDEYQSTYFIPIAACSAKIVASSATFTTNFKSSNSNTLYGPAWIFEFSGLDPTTWRDHASVVTQDPDGGAVSVTSGSGNTTNNALVFAFVSARSGTGVNMTMTTAATGYTSAFNYTGNQDYAWDISYKILTSTETSSSAWVYAGGTFPEANAGLVVYRGVDGGGGGTRPSNMLLMGTR